MTDQRAAWREIALKHVTWDGPIPQWVTGDVIDAIAEAVAAHEAERNTLLEMAKLFCDSANAAAERKLAKIVAECEQKFPEIGSAYYRQLGAIRERILAVARGETTT